jgi:hypothetical protein
MFTSGAQFAIKAELDDHECGLTWISSLEVADVFSEERNKFERNGPRTTLPSRYFPRFVHTALHLTF